MWPILIPSIFWQLLALFFERQLEMDWYSGRNGKFRVPSNNWLDVSNPNKDVPEGRVQSCVDRDAFWNSIHTLSIQERALYRFDCCIVAITSSTIDYSKSSVQVVHVGRIWLDRLVKPNGSSIMRKQRNISIYFSLCCSSSILYLNSLPTSCLDECDPLRNLLQVMETSLVGFYRLLLFTSWKLRSSPSL